MVQHVQCRYAGNIEDPSLSTCLYEFWVVAIVIDLLSLDTATEGTWFVASHRCPAGLEGRNGDHMSSEAYQRFNRVAVPMTA
jgi:hypothetical protein